MEITIDSKEVIFLVEYVRIVDVYLSQGDEAVAIDALLRASHDPFTRYVEQKDALFIAHLGMLIERASVGAEHVTVVVSEWFSDMQVVFDNPHGEKDPDPRLEALREKLTSA